MCASTHMDSQTCMNTYTYKQNKNIILRVERTLIQPWTSLVPWLLKNHSWDSPGGPVTRLPSPPFSLRATEPMSARLFSFAKASGSHSSLLPGQLCVIHGHSVYGSEWAVERPSCRRTFPTWEKAQSRVCKGTQRTCGRGWRRLFPSFHLLRRQDYGNTSWEKGTEDREADCVSNTGGHVFKLDLEISALCPRLLRKDVNAFEIPGLLGAALSAVILEAVSQPGTQWEA